MSRAFVKETDNDPVGFPDRPISPHRNLVTEAGLAGIEAALDRFETAHRDAEDKGDREAAGAALREVRYWKARRASAEVVKPPEDKSKASFGKTVTLRREDGRKQSFKIVGEDVARSPMSRHWLAPCLRMAPEIQLSSPTARPFFWTYAERRAARSKR